MIAEALRAPVSDGAPLDTARGAPDPARIRAALGISRERMGRLLDVSAKTVERMERQERLPASARARAQIAGLQEIVALGLRVYTPEGFARFLATPLPAFGKRSALQTIEQGQADLVLATLAADYEGLGS